VSEKLRFEVLKSLDILEKSGAARAMKTTLTYENQDSAPDYAKNEDPAKMTYSIPDFVKPQHDPELEHPNVGDLTVLKCLTLTTEQQ
jgi:hypothetical protein